MGRTGVERRFVDEAVAEVAVTASDLVADRELAQLTTQVCDVGANRDHDVSILITFRDAAGRWRGEAPRSNVSMMTMRPPQHGHGYAGGVGSFASAQWVSVASDCAAGTASSSRARVMLSARVPLANRP